MRGTALARFWRIERTREGLAFENARGQFVDLGAHVLTRDGNDAELRGILDVAAAKGWTELTFTGEDAFKLRGMAAALERGFEIRALGRDADLLREVIDERGLHVRTGDVRRRFSKVAPSPDGRAQNSSRQEPDSRGGAGFVFISTSTNATVPDGER